MKSVKGSKKAAARVTVVTKHGGGTYLELQFKLLEGFTLDRKKVKKGDYVKDTRSNRDKVEAAHATNKTVKRKADLGKKKEDGPENCSIRRTRREEEARSAAAAAHELRRSGDVARPRRRAERDGRADRRSRSRTRPRPAPSAAAEPVRRRASAAAQPRDDGTPPPRGAVHDAARRSRRAAARAGQSVSHGGCVDYPPHVVGCEFSPTQQDLHYTCATMWPHARSDAYGRRTRPGRPTTSCRAVSSEVGGHRARRRAAAH